MTQGSEVAPDLPPAFNADHRGHLALLVNADEVVRSQRSLEVIWVGGDHPIDDVDLVKGPPNCLVTGEGAVDIYRPELPPDAAGMQPRHVGHQRVARPFIRPAGEVGDAEAVIFLQLLGNVVVTVDQRRFLEDSVDARLDFGIDRQLGGE